MIRRLTFLGLVLMFPLGAQAQPMWTASTPVSNVTVEGYKPGFSNGEGITLLTSSWFLSGRYGLSPRVGVVVEVGVSHFGQDVYAGDGAVIDEVRETAMGNVLLSVTYALDITGLTLMAGVRLPTASDTFGGVTGIYVDPYRYEAFLLDYTSFLLEADYVLPITEELRLRLGARPSIHLDHFDGPIDRGGTDVAIRFAVQGWYETDQMRAALGVTGSSSLVTGLHMGVHDTTALALGASASLRLGLIEPGLILQLPLTREYDELIDGVVGLMALVPLP